MTKIEISRYIKNAFTAAAPQVVKTFTEKMIQGKTNYESLSDTERKNEGKVCNAVDIREYALIDCLNDGLNFLSLKDGLKFCSSKDFDWCPKKDRDEGDIYLIHEETKTIVANFDLKTSLLDAINPESTEYNTRTGFHLGGEIGWNSFLNFPKENHYYLLSTYDGKVILLVDSLTMRDTFIKNKVFPTKSKIINEDGELEESFFTVKNHLSKWLTLNKEVFVVRNVTDYKITCFKNNL